MMTAYQPQPGGAMHPGMAPHGHPAMTPGQPMNPAQMQQMGHPGPVTPGPHVTQGQAMMGMQPGANAMAGHAIGGQHPGMAAQMAGQNIAGGAPNAHTMNHMNPQAALQQQQIMQQQMQANPQLVQQQMMQRRMAQMQANGGMPGMQHAAMQGLNAQQMQQLQQNSMAHAQGGQMPQLPQHLQAQQLQLHMAQQQQRQAAAVAQQNQQMQQQLAMQQANSQQSNQGAQAAAQGQQAAQPQHPGQPMRPQSRMANPNEQSQGGPQQGPQQTPQQSQAQQAQQQQQQAQAQAQAQQAQQGQSSQQQAQTPNQQQQGQQMASQNAQQLQAMQRQRAAQMQQQNAMQQQRQMQQQMQLQQAAQQQQSGGGQFILRAILFADQLSGFNSESGKDIAQWHNFVDKHFAPEGRFIHSFPAQSAEVTGRKFEVARPTIPRYFQMYFDSNATAVRLHLEHVREGGLAGNRHHVTFNHATLTITYSNGARLELDGWAKMLFKDSDAIELMELHTLKSEEHINRSEIERVLANYSPNMANKSPKATKSKLPKAQQKLQSQFDGLTIDHFPKTPKSILGTSDRVQQFLEISETMNIMADLVSFAQEKKMRPEPAIDALVQIYEAQGGSAVQQQPQQGNPQINLPPNGVPSGNRTPSMQNMQIANAQGANLFNSPSVANLNLPMQNGVPGMNGSPHIAHNQGLAPNNMNMANSHSPSPHQTNMAAPMVPQHSQQGTNSSAASANTSPNVNNKRRRSTVKTENDDGAAEGSQGANRVKPSPRMPKKAKPGGGG